MNFNGPFFLHYLFFPSSVYLHGLMLTIVISIIAETAGTIIGVLVALAKMSGFRALHLVVRFYIWIFRGTPLLVQIIFLYTALAAANIFRFEDINIFFITIPGNVQAGIVALSLHEGAYMAEIVRAGIDSVPAGQNEAARSLGLSYWQVMRWIVLPQAARFVVPPLGNQFNLMLKNTSLLSVIGVQELLLATETLTSVTFRVFELYAVVALYYLSLTTVWGWIQIWLEEKFGGHEGSAEKKSGIRRLLFD